VDRNLDVPLRAEVEFVCDLALQGVYRNRFSPIRAVVAFSRGVRSNSSRELDFGVRRDPIRWRDLDVIPIYT
jgi:hypothetical protein